MRVLGEPAWWAGVSTTASTLALVQHRWWWGAAFGAAALFMITAASFEAKARSKQLCPQCLATKVEGGRS
jgi:hypothetical protein